MKNSTSLSEIALSDRWREHLNQLGYTSLTEIQAQSLPLILKGEDVLGQAQTGSGKTAAFAIGLLNRLTPGELEPQALILCPTRELADQVAKEVRRLAQCLENIKVLTLTGGQPIGAQLHSLRYGAQVVVGTPGRICDHLRKGSLRLRRLKTLVLDEADRMLDMGFQEDMQSIVDHTPPNRQTLLFSATFPPSVSSLSDGIQTKAKFVRVEESEQKHLNIKQSFYHTSGPERLDHLATLLSQAKPTSTVIFCNTRQMCTDTTTRLRKLGFAASALQGDMEQRQRDSAIRRFTHQSLTVLVATDVAARGLDVDHVDTVINLELPKTVDVYIHRIGRTGRAGRKGNAYSFVLAREQHRVEKLDEHFGSETTIKTLRINPNPSVPPKPSMATIEIDAGKKQKIRPGDIVGALTNGGDIKGDQIGKIDVTDFNAYVSVQAALAKTAVKKLAEKGIKKKRVRARKV